MEIENAAVVVGGIPVQRKRGRPTRKEQIDIAVVAPMKNNLNEPTDPKEATCRRAKKVLQENVEIGAEFISVLVHGMTEKPMASIIKRRRCVK